MIRLHYDARLPALAAVAQQGEDVVICVNQYAQMLLDFDQRKALFNDLMSALERRGTLVDLAERRELREIGRLLDLTRTPTEKASHGVDQIPTQR